jgi:hypothetical protein
MNSKGYFNLLILIILIILIIIYNLSHNQSNLEEGFTPHIRKLYRPYIRHARMFSEEYYGHGTNNMNKLFRQFGLY